MLETVKKNKGKLLLSSSIILLPIVAGVLLWDRLPQQMATHWGIGGKPDGWSSRGFAVFGLPLLMLALNWFCLLAEQGNFRRNPKPMWLVFWICPAVSFFGGAATYAYALGLEFEMHYIAVLLCAAMFILIGNYLPKCRQNYTLGIKLKWTFESEKNWNATHRFGGRVWVFVGAVMLLAIFLPQNLAFYAIFGLMTAAVAAPIVYSYLYSRRENDVGDGDGHAQN